MKNKIKNRSISLNKISEIINLNLIGENIYINALNYSDFESEYNSVLVYCLSKRYVSIALKKKNVKAIITNDSIYKEISEEQKNKVSYFISKNPKSTFYELHNYLANNTNFYGDFDFKLKIGKNSNIHSSSIIEEGVVIGNNVTISPNVVIKKGTVIEDNVFINCNSVIGSNNIELFELNDRITLVKHVGGTKIYNNAYIGSNSVVACNIFEGFCEIGSETYVDNLVHVSHNNRIGKKNIITTGVTISGSVIIGDNCWISNGATITNGIIIGNDVKINTGAVVVENIPDNKTVAGFYALDNHDWLIHTAKLRKSIKRK